MEGDLMGEGEKKWMDGGKEGGSNGVDGWKKGGSGGRREEVEGFRTRTRMRQVTFIPSLN
jgi:hypothetical protein